MRVGGGAASALAVGREVLGADGVTQLRSGNAAEHDQIARLEGAAQGNAADLLGAGGGHCSGLCRPVGLQRSFQRQLVAGGADRLDPLALVTDRELLADHRGGELAFDALDQRLALGHRRRSRRLGGLATGGQPRQVQPGDRHPVEVQVIEQSAQGGHARSAIDHLGQVGLGRYPVATSGGAQVVQHIVADAEHGREMDQLVGGLADARQGCSLHQALSAQAHAPGHIAQRLADRAADRRVEVADFEGKSLVAGLEVQADRVATDFDVSGQVLVIGIQCQRDIAVQ